MPDQLEQAQRAFIGYTVEKELGRGGMATVYLAHDRKHDRKVAIKILHAEIAAVLGAERFLQEIKVTAFLQHPHILVLIDSGVIGEDGGELRGRPYYVMPFINGESLRQRLDNERQLPVSDAIRIATEVASALDYAHRHGVVHRDIKPENILLHDGSAIVADFGIALAVTQAGGERMTQSGISLGTPTYMSPEQAAGERALTGRSDIYSLGVVTYEMLAGEPPFRAATPQAVVAKVMTEEPRLLTTQRPNVPPQVEAAVSRALEKVPADRFGSGHEFAEALNEPTFVRSVGASARLRDDATSHQRLLLYAAGVLAIVTTAAALRGYTRPAETKRMVEYAEGLDSGEAIAPGRDWGGRLAISRDGMTIAYIGGPRREVLILHRDELHATAIPGSEGSSTPFFSPDDQRIGFVASNSTLKHVMLNGASPVVVSDSAVGNAGATWARDGTIYVDALPAGSGLIRVNGNPGSLPTLFTRLDTASGEIDHTQPEVLPNQKGVLFTIESAGKNGVRLFEVAVADIPSGKYHVVVRDAMDARYAAPGRLLYVTSQGILMSAAFDMNSMIIRGNPTQLVESMRRGRGGSSDLAVSDEGTLVYATSGREDYQLVWVTRDGKAQAVDPAWTGGQFEGPSISPDGKRLSVSRGTEGQPSDIWLKWLDRGASERLTFNGSDNLGAGWTPDGKAVTYISAANKGNPVTKRVDGGAEEVMHLRGQAELFNARWSPDAKWLIYQNDATAARKGDILGIRPGVDSVPVTLVATEFSDVAPIVSPNGRFMAYASDETGQFEIYVVPFPDTHKRKWGISTHGGTEPLWSHRGNELFYRDGSGYLVSAQVTTVPTFSLGRSTQLFSAREYFSVALSWEYAVSPDDKRFMMIQPLSARTSDKIMVVENWVDDLGRKSRR